MTNAQPDPAEIARRLSPAQKWALLWLPALGSMALLHDVLSSGHFIGVWSSLEKAGTVELFKGLGIGLTPLGQSVRAALKDATDAQR